MVSMMTTRPVNPNPPAFIADRPIVLKAFHFACHAHRDQVRKYSGEPYIYHPIEVATILFESFPDNPPPDDVLSAALLHDVVEDCNVTFTELRREFGESVASIVMQLTDLITTAQGNRESRKVLEADRLRWSCPAAQTIKIADMISNTISIVANDKDFAVVYLSEKRRALQSIAISWFHDRQAMLDNAAVKLLNRATEMVQLARINLNINKEGGSIQ